MVHQAASPGHNKKQPKLCSWIAIHNEFHNVKLAFYQNTTEMKWDATRFSKQQMIH